MIAQSITTPTRHLDMSPSYLITTGLIGAGTVKLTTRSPSAGRNTKVRMIPASTLTRVVHLKNIQTHLCNHYHIVPNRSTYLTEEYTFSKTILHLYKPPLTPFNRFWHLTCFADEHLKCRSQLLVSHIYNMSVRYLW